MQGSLIAATAAVLVYMVIWFLVSLALGRNEVADVAWGEVRIRRMK